ncbi:MAG: formyltransferase family protein [Alphaproteobacteria bacterium]|nr:formyltransferase family protein [Alphaproteobacteria bacterium]
MARNQNYKVLVMTSLPETIDTVTAMTRQHFSNVESIYWEMGNKETKPVAYARIEACDYNLIISYINGIILNPGHLARATFGAINIHPAPPEHPGLWGQWCQPVIRRDIRTHHGVTLHEIDEEINHGPIYAVERWDVGASDSIESVGEKSEEKCLDLLAFALYKLAMSSHGSRCFTPIDEHWDADNAHHGVADVQAWFRDLDPGHPAHQDRVFFNHPKGMMAPPYFTDLV